MTRIHLTLPAAALTSEQEDELRELEDQFGLACGPHLSLSSWLFLFPFLLLPPPLSHSSLLTHDRSFSLDRNLVWPKSVLVLAQVSEVAH